MAVWIALVYLIDDVQDPRTSSPLRRLILRLVHYHRGHHGSLHPRRVQLPRQVRALQPWGVQFSWPVGALVARGVEFAGDVGAVVVRGVQRGGVGADVWVVKGVLVVLVLRAVMAEGVAVAWHVAGVASAGGQ